MKQAMVLKLTAWGKSVISWLARLRESMSAHEKAILVVLSIVFCVSLAMSVRAYIERNSFLIPQSGGRYTEAAVGQPRHINPILAGTNDLDLDLTTLVYSSLLKLTNDLTLAGDLATGYEVSDNGLEYTVHLRDDVMWHDGRPFGADDVVFTIRSIQTPEYGSPLASSFQGVRVEKVNDTTVSFRLKQPYTPFPTNLTVGIVPKHVWEGIPPKNASLAEQMLKPIGTGPFKFAEIVTRRKTGEPTSIRLERNTGYYAQKPYLDEINVIFFATQDEAVAALTANEVDGVGFLPLALAKEIQTRRLLALKQIRLPQYLGLFFNELKSDLLGDAGVRAALSLATDRERLAEQAMRGYAEVLHVPIPKGLFDFSRDIQPPTFDRAVAVQNLAEAGWSDKDGNGILEKDDRSLSFKISTVDWPEYVATAELLKSQWKEIGIETQIEYHSAGVIQQTVVGPREYEILLYGEILPADPDPYPFWHSTQARSPGLNLSLFKDTEIDKLLEDARKEQNHEKRRELYVKFLERFLDLNPAIVLYRPFYLYAHNKTIRGQTVEQTYLPAGRFSDISLWHVNIKRVWK